MTYLYGGIGNVPVQGPLTQKTFDLKNHNKAAFEILVRGYAQKFDAQSGWQQLNGPQAMQSKRAASAPIGSRRERRARQYKASLKLSKVSWGKP